MTKRRPPGAPDGGEFSGNAREEAGVDLGADAPFSHASGLRGADLAAHLAGGEAKKESEAREELAKGREVLADLDAVYEGLSFEKRAEVDKAAKSFNRAPWMLFANLAFTTVKMVATAGLAAPDVKAAWNTWRTRKIWKGSGGEMAKYAAIIQHTQAFDPTKGSGDEMLVAAKRAYLADRTPTRATESRIPRQP